MPGLRLPRFPRFRFSLRALAVFVTLFCLWGGYHANRAHVERGAQALLHGRGQTISSIRANAGLLSRFDYLVSTIVWKEKFITRARVPPDLSQDEIEALSGLPRLEAVTLDAFLIRGGRGRRPMFRKHITDGALEQILAHRQLEALAIRGCKLTHGDCRAIQAHTTLREVQLHGMDLSDRALFQVLTLPRIEIVDISDTRVDGDSVQMDKGSPSLKELTFRGRSEGTILGSCLPDFISGCKNLTLLTVGGVDVDDRFISKVEFHPSLQDVTIWGPSLTRNCIDSLLTLPQLKVARVPSSVLDAEKWSLITSQRPDLHIEPIPVELVELLEIHKS